MSFLTRIQKSKKILADIKKPNSSFELKYGNMTAEQAWDQFFKLFIIRFKHASKITADTTTPLQWKTLSDIYNFLDDKVIRLSDTVADFKVLMAKYGTDAYPKAFRENYDEIEGRVSEMKTGSYDYRQKALRQQITQHTLYLKYDPYLQELLKLTTEKLFDEYFLQGKMPLDTFDETCVEQEGDPIKNLDPKSK